MFACYPSLVCLQRGIVFIVYQKINYVLKSFLSCSKKQKRNVIKLNFERRWKMSDNSVIKKVLTSVLELGVWLSGAC